MRIPASKLPSEGPIVLEIPVISGVQILGGASSSELEYRWPRRYKLAGVLLMPVAFAAGTIEAAAAALRLRMVDDQQVSLATDTLALDTLSFSVPGLAMSGRGNALGLVDGLGGYMPRWHAIDRVVNAGDVYRIQIQNTGAAAVTPWLGFRVEVLP
jgi:hypothetical protein